MKVKLNINGDVREVETDPDTPLLWVLRDVLRLTGTKFGCGVAACGACTVHLNGEAVRSCQTFIGDLDEAVAITTIEGIRGPEGELHPVQQAWIDEQAPQCGYCQSGQIMNAAALLAANPSPTDEEIVDAMDGNLCRCGSYSAIRRAIKRAASSTTGSSNG